MSAFSHVGGEDIERICDVCGVRRAMRRLRTVGVYKVCEKHPGWVPPEQLERLPIILVGSPQPVKNARPFEGRDTFEEVEGELFNFVSRDSAVGDEDFNRNNCAQGPPSTTGSIRAVAWQGVYLYSLI